MLIPFCMLQISTPGNRGVSAYSLFGLDIHLHQCRLPQVSAQLRDLVIILIDEFSFMNPNLLMGLHKSCVTARKGLVPDAECKPFAGIHVVVLGDPCQHSPVTPPSLAALSQEEGSAATLPHSLHCPCITNTVWPL